MRPTWTPELILALRDRVSAHNDRARVLGADTVGLGDLKKTYSAGYRRSADPHARALGKVDDLLNARLGAPGGAAIVKSSAQLVKSGSFEADQHPRGQGGEFTGKSLPASPAEHGAQQDNNAGYQALTSDAIPDHRREIAGSIIRTSVAAGAGLALTASLLQGRPNGLVQASTRWAAGKVGRLASHAVANLALAGAVGGSSTARRFGLKGRIAAYTNVQAAAHARAAAAQGESAGRYVGGGIGNTASKVARLAMRTIAGPDTGGKTFGRTVRRGLATAVVASVPAVAIDRTVKGSIVDPEAVGRGVDAFSYRVVRKDASLDAVAAEMTRVLRKAEQAGGLEKAIPGLFTIGRAVIPSLAATVAAGAAGLTAHLATRPVSVSGEDGNPYHDARGRFTHKESAAIVGGSALGAAALAGGTVLALLNRHNHQALTAAGARIADRLTRGAARALNARTGSQVPNTRLGEMLDHHSAAVSELVDKDPRLAEQIGALNAHGGSAVIHFSEQVRSEINGKIAELLHGMDEVRIPVRGKDVSLAEIRTGLGRRQDGASAAFRAVHVALDHMTIEQFDHAVAPLQRQVKGPGGKMLAENPVKARVAQQARDWFLRRSVEVAAVPGKLAAHHEKIEKAQAALKPLQETAKAALDRFGTAEVDVTAAPDTGKAAAEGVRAAAATAHDTALAAVTKAKAKLDKLQSGPPVVESPVTGKPIAPANPQDLQIVKDKAREQAHGRAVKKVDAAVEAERHAHVGRLTEAATRARAALAVLGHRTGGAPRSAKDAAADLLTSHTAYLDAVDKHGHAARAASGAVEDQTRLRAVLKGKMPKGLSAEAAEDLKRRAEEVESRVPETAAARDRSAAELELARSQRRDHAEAFAKALEGEGDAQHARPSARRMRAMQALRADLHRVHRGVSEPIAAFLKRPTVSNLVAFAERQATALKQVGGSALGGIKGGATTAYNEAFRRKGDDGQWHLSPTKVLWRAGLAASGLEAAREYAAYGHTKLFGTVDAKAKAALPAHVKLEKDLDPVTGRGFVALTLPDDKGERQILWGQRYENATDAPIALMPGGRLSTLRLRLAEMKQNATGGHGGHGGQLRNLNLQQHDAEAYKKGFEAARQDNKIVTANVPDGGPSFQYRHHSDEKGNEAAGRVMGAVRKNLGKGELEGAAYWNGLRDVFSVQGRVLKTRQIAALLTGQNDGIGAFKRNPDFKGSASDALGALQAEVARVQGKFAPANNEERALLHKAVHAVALAKDIPATDLQHLHAGVRGMAAAGASEPAAAASHEPRGVSIDEPFATSLPREWNTDKLQQASHQAVQNIAPVLGLGKPHEKENLAEVVQALARTAKGTKHGADLTEHEAATAAMRAIRSVAKGGSVNAEMARDAIVNVDPEAFGDALDQEIRSVRSRRTVAKAILLDDFDALAKIFGGAANDALGDVVDAVANEARVPSGSHGGGQFASGGGISTSKMLTRHLVEGVSDAGENAARSALRTKSPASQAWYNPVRVANEGGAALAGEAAWQAASIFLPEVKWASLAAEGAGAFAASAGKKALRMGATTIAGQAGGFAGQHAGHLAVRGAYAAVGSKASDYRPPEYHSTSEMGAELAGGIGGTFAGTTAGRVIGGALGSIGGPAGTVAGAMAGTVVGGALGNYLGGQLSRAGFNWFSGHDQAQVSRAVNRYMPKATPAVAAA